jgi:hypothetical protein
MSYDSLSEVWQVTTGHWTAKHSVAYDALIWASLKSTGDVAMLALLQTVAMSASLSCLGLALRRLRAPAGWIVAATVIVAAVPATGGFTISIWKDVPLAICTVLMAATILRLCAGERSRTHFVALAAELFGICLFRNNGFLVAAIGLLIVVIFLGGVRRSLLLFGVPAIVAAIGVNSLFFPALGVKGVRPTLTYATAYGDLAVAYARVPSEFTKADKRLLKQVSPLSHWKAAGKVCSVSDPLTGGDPDDPNPQFNVNAADRLHTDLVSLWVKMIKRSPNVVFGARLCRSTIAWSPFPTNRVDHAQVFSNPDVAKGAWGWTSSGGKLADSSYRGVIRTRPLSATLHRAAKFVWLASKTSQLEWLLWRGATWCYVAYAALFLLGARRRTPWLMAAAAALAGQQIGFVLACPAPLYRYMAGPMIIGLMFLPLLAAWWRERPDREPVRT